MRWIVQLLSSRFKESHSISLVEDNGQTLCHSHLDQLLAVWEWRSGPTPWLVMKSNAGIEKKMNIKIKSLFESKIVRFELDTPPDF